MPRTLDRPNDDSNSREKNQKVSENKYKYMTIDEMLDRRNFFKMTENIEEINEIDAQLRLKLNYR